MFNHHREGDFPRDVVTVLGMATIPMTNDHPKDGCHPGDGLEDFDHFGEGDLPWDGQCPRNGDHYRYDDQ